MRIPFVTLAVIVLALPATSCSKLLPELTSPTSVVAPPQTGESFCAQLPTIGTGRLFFCGSSQSNLQLLPNNLGGYCMAAAANNLGLVGYSAVTFAGGTDLVRSMAEATDMCNNLNVGGLRQCGSIVRCTRQ